MSVTYPLAFPSNVGVKRVTFGTNSVVAVSTSPFTAVSQIQAFSGQFWSGVVTLPKLTREQAATWRAFLAKLNGQEGTFLFGDPASTTLRGGATGAIEVDGTHSALASSLRVRGLTPGLANAFMEGDYIQLGSGSTSRLHKVLNTVNATGSSGEAQLDIWPALRYSVSNGATVTISNCKSVFRLATNEVSWNYDENPFYDFAFPIIEALG